MSDQNASFAEKTSSVGGLALGIFAPGGGYGFAAKKANNVVDAARVVESGYMFDNVEETISNTLKILEKPIVKDEKLYNRFIKRLYQENDKYLGGTAGAVIKELLTAEPTRNKWHFQKAQDAVNGLYRWIRANPKADAGDLSTVKTIIKDLQTSLDTFID